MMPVPPMPNPYLDELRVKERAAERERKAPMFSRKAALIGIAVVLILIIGSFVLFYAFR